MLKKIGSFFIGFFMLIFVGVLSVFLGIRLFFEPTSMSVLMEHIVEEEEFWEEMDITEEEFNKYIDKDEFSDMLGEFISDYFKYSGGVKGAKKPSLEPFKELIEDFIKDYEKETNTKFDREEIDKYLNELEEDMDEELFGEEPDEDIKIVFNVIYSDTIVIVLIAIILGFIGLDFLLRKNPAIISLHAGIVSGINAFTFYALKLVLGVVDVSDEFEEAALAMISNVFNRIGLVSLILAIILIVIFVLLKDKYKEENNNNNNQYNQNNMNNYNGYDNSNYNMNNYNNYNNYNNSNNSF